jgi:hypothetical protein
MEVTDEQWRLLAVLFLSSEIWANQTHGSISPATAVNKAVLQVTGEPKPKRLLESKRLEPTMKDEAIQAENVLGLKPRAYPHVLTYSQMVCLTCQAGCSKQEWVVL